MNTGQRAATSRVTECLRRVGDALDPPPPRSPRTDRAVRVRRLVIDLEAADARYAERRARRRAASLTPPA